ncbi:MAG: hypothetical protein QG641_1656, partial [Candidatus Poribacteria bacterium]|nr:hypothetical protein [Candidatus Poribacteria bacterium]
MMKLDYEIVCLSEDALKLSTDVGFEALYV